jgi:hypothetical protein
MQEGDCYLIDAFNPTVAWRCQEKLRETPVRLFSSLMQPGFEPIKSWKQVAALPLLQAAWYDNSNELNSDYRPCSVCNVSPGLFPLSSNIAGRNGSE